MIVTQTSKLIQRRIRITDVNSGVLPVLSPEEKMGNSVEPNMEGTISSI